jgi:hypothetical protein
VLDALSRLDERASEWTRSSTARTLAKVGIGLSVLIWIVTGVVLWQRGGDFSALEVRVLWGVSFFAFIFVLAAAVSRLRKSIPTGEGKSPARSALTWALVGGGVSFALRSLTSSPAEAAWQAALFGALLAAGRYFAVRQVNRDSRDGDPSTDADR